MRKEDKLLLQSYKVILKKYTENIYIYGDYNIYGVFIHEVIIFIGSAFLNTIDPPLIEKPKLKFPFVNKKYISEPAGNFWEDEKDKVIFRRNLISGFLKFRYLGFLLLNIKNSLYSRRKISIYQLPISEMEADIFALVKKGYFVEFLKGSEKVFMPDLEKQIKELQQTLFYIFESILNIKAESILEPFLERLTSYCTDNKQNFKKKNVLITGSLSVLKTRISAINFKINGGKVISLAHGTNSFLGFNEPIVGYGELSYVDYYIDFGSNNKDTSALEYQKPLSHQPIIISRSSKIILKFLQNRSEFYFENKADKILYIPTGFSGSYRYGPFRDISDNYYTKWQKALLKSNSNIIYKSHPYSCPDTRKIFESDLSNKIVSSNLLEIDIENSYDIIILDYFGTAHSIAAATSKPIIYFNLGLRNMETITLTLFKKRVFWYDIQMDLPFEQQISDAFYAFQASKKNYDYDSFTKYDSISEKNIFIDQII